MTIDDSHSKRVLELAADKGIVHRRDIAREGLPRDSLARLERSGHLERLAPGVYAHVGADLGEHVELAVVAKRAPRAVFFGITALSVHELTTQIPRSVEIAVERDTWAPRLEWPRVDVFTLSGASFSTGIEEVEIAGGVAARIYTVAKTVADLFKFRRRFGLDVALEALREGWREGRFGIEELDACAKACRVDRVMRPYLEAIF